MFLQRLVGTKMLRAVMPATRACMTENGRSRKIYRQNLSPLALAHLLSARSVRLEASSRDVAMAGQDAAPARGIRNLPPGTPRVTVRSNYVGLPSMAGLGRAREAKASR
jgi:hypothetical protein